ncbi:MAG: hypothetical protein ABWK05_04560 [Pyrobaculum sp.]
MGDYGFGALIAALFFAIPVFMIAVTLPAPLQYAPPILYIGGFVYLVWRYWREEEKVKRLIQEVRSGGRIRAMSGVLKVVAPRGPVEFVPWGAGDEVEPGPYVYIEWGGVQYSVAVGPLEFRNEWGAYFQAWGYRVLDPCCEGLYVVKIDPLKAYSLSARLSFSTEWGDTGRVALRPAGPGAVEVEAWLTRARSVRVELIAKTEYGAASVILLEAGEGASRAKVSLAGGPATLILTKPPYDFARAFPQRIAGLAPTPNVEYVVRAVLDMPAARDVVFEEKAEPAEA